MFIVNVTRNNMQFHNLQNCKYKRANNTRWTKNNNLFYFVHCNIQSQWLFYFNNLLMIKYVNNLESK